MTNQHPIAPPEELRDEWESEWHHQRGQDTYEEFMAKQAARWGADQELEACVEWLQDPDLNVDTYKLRAARRPSAQSLKEQALESVKRFEKSGEFFSYQMRELEFIRKALEQLDD